MRHALLALVLAATPLSATAMEVVTDRAAFLGTVQGKTLNIGLYGLRLVVTPDGAITGRAAGRDVTGQWNWQDGFFCRSMAWGQRAIPYNCQLVQASGNRLRFTSDRGAGDAATFTLR
ncbi:MAG: dihydrodipicolinate reductase [Shimia sp.]